jgi:hypothetical protein
MMHIGEDTENDNGGQGDRLASIVISDLNPRLRH